MTATIATRQSNNVWQDFCECIAYRFTEEQVNELLSNAMETQYNAYKSYYAS